MKHFINFLKRKRDTALLTGTLALLVLAMLRPTILIKHDIFTYLLVADISQSMNTPDMKINGEKTSRMEFMKKTMHDVISSLPCKTKVSVALFAGEGVAALYQPIEVCDNFHEIQDTIDHLEWRTAWSGNSRVRGSLSGIARAVRSFPEPAQVVFFTDGEEAPKLHAFNTKDLSSFQEGDDWLIVGIGSEEGAAIPKLSEHNQIIGYWSNESFALQPGIAQISESNIGTRDDSIAAGESDRYISKLDEKYLMSVAEEINGLYVRGDSVHSVLQAMRQQKPASRDLAPFDLHWILAGLAGILLIAAYIDKHPVRQFLSLLRIYKKNKKRHLKNETAIAHDNYIS